MRRFRQGERVVHVESGAELVCLENAIAIEGFSCPVLCTAQDSYGARVIVDECDLEARPVSLRDGCSEAQNEGPGACRVRRRHHFSIAMEKQFALR